MGHPQMRVASAYEARSKQAQIRPKWARAQNGGANKPKFVPSGPGPKVGASQVYPKKRIASAYEGRSKQAQIGPKWARAQNG